MDDAEIRLLGIYPGYVQVACNLARHNPSWGDPVHATGLCVMATWRYLWCLQDAGLAGVEVEGYNVIEPARENPFVVHSFAVVRTLGRDFVIDMTARQFWPEVAYPLIEPMSSYAGRFQEIWCDAPNDEWAGLALC